MDASTEPEITVSPQIIVERPAEKYSVREVAIEQIARLLARADGKNPDDDWRMGNGTMLTVHCEGDACRVWYGYREKAETLLRQAFAKTDR